MSTLLRIPHGYIRRHLATVERGMVAAGLSILLYWLLTSLPVYPSPWEVVVAVSVFFVMIWSPGAAYFLAVSAALYPLYTVSLYIAVLFLAAALLGQRVFIQNLGATLLVLLTPWLAQFNLAWLTPLLAGLWWGKSGGAWIGGSAALWGQILLGMSGSSPDWLAALGTTPSLASTVQRFQAAGSLETLLLIVTPLASNPTLLLYHLLQILLWAVAAGMTGGLSETAWAQYHRPLRATVIVFAGALLLLAGHLGLASWLEQYPGDRLASLAPQLVLAMLASTFCAALLETGRDFIEHPLAVRTAPATAARPESGLAGKKLGLMRVFRRAQPAQDETATEQSAQYPPMPVPPEVIRRSPQKQQPDDIIKIELD